jgi:hypothetical protein
MSWLPNERGTDVSRRSNSDRLSLGALVDWVTNHREVVVVNPEIIGDTLYGLN